MPWGLSKRGGCGRAMDYEDAMTSIGALAISAAVLTGMVATANYVRRLGRRRAAQTTRPPSPQGRLIDMERDPETGVYRPRGAA